MDKTVTFTPLCDADQVFLSRLRAEEDWPLRDRSLAAWQQWLEERQISELLGEGLYRSIRAGSQIVGFSTWDVVPESDVEGYRVVECGTFLRASARGQGYNAAIKRGQWVEAAARWQADWCVYLIGVQNHRAREAMRKLACGMTEVTLGDPHFLSRWLRRRTWKTGEAATLFAIPIDGVQRFLSDL